MSRKSLSTLTVMVTGAVMVVGIAASSAQAGRSGGHHGGGHSGHHGGGHYNHHSNHRVHHTPVVVRKVVVNHCHHPRHCLAYVTPGETLLSICLREYGNPGFWTKVARFNHIPLNAPLAVGQPIKLPKIYDNGSMALSTAPAPPAPVIVAPVVVHRPITVMAPALPAPVIIAPVAVPRPIAVVAPALPAPVIVAPVAVPRPIAIAAPAVGIGPAPIAGPAPQLGSPQGQPQLRQGPQQLPPAPQQGQGLRQRPAAPQQSQGQVPAQQVSQPATQQPQANVRAFERTVPTFTVGSQLVLDGQQFGGTPGRVQLMVGPMAMPVQIMNWTPSEVTVQLPELSLTKAAEARVVVLDANGKMVTSSTIRISPAASRLAMGN